MLSSAKLRPLVGVISGGRAVSAGLAGGGRKAPPATFNLAARSVSVLGRKSQKHLLSEFKGVKGPQSQEVCMIYCCSLLVHVLLIREDSKEQRSMV